MEKNEVLNDLFGFKGHMNRGKYIYYTILTLFIGFVISTIGIIGYYNFYIGETGLMIILGSMFILAMYVSVAISIKRIREIDNPMWWIILLVILVVDFVVGLVLLIKRGTTEVNRYGEGLLENKKFTKSMLISIRY